MKKKFLVIANHNAITYKEIFGLMKDDKIWLGYTHPRKVHECHESLRGCGRLEAGEKRTEPEIGVALENACWFTNLDIAKETLEN